MAIYKEIEYPKTQVKKAGRIFAGNSSPEAEREDALKIINNWRAAHAFPLQIIYCNVKNKVPFSAIVAQRLKRLESITKKLERFPNMSLSTMQDIGGCRIIVPTLEDVYVVADKIAKSQWKHKFKEAYDYIKQPKSDGYRCYHMVYSYKSDKNSKYNGLFIEIQIRTNYQHLWATAVETMDEIDGQSLKTGNGSEVNGEFFRLTSLLLKEFEELGYSVEAVRNNGTVMRIREFENENHILNRLSSIRATNNVIVSGNVNGYYLLKSDGKEQTTDVEFYKKVVDATMAYERKEKERLPHQDVVLVSTSSIDALKKAYPNYFSNVSDFVDTVNELINEK